MFLDTWYPEQHTTVTTSDRLKEGDVVALKGKAFRIDRVDEVPIDRWPTDFVEMWQQSGMPEAATWIARPMAVTGRWQGPNADPRICATMARVCHAWDVLPEHYSVCHQCFEIPPCHHAYNETLVASKVASMVRDLELQPGICHACRESITNRQRSVVFPGPNLIRPDLPEGTATFHTRDRCSRGLRAYERRAGHPPVDPRLLTRPSGGPKRPS